MENPDAIVIGSGLAGLTAALHICDRGGKVVVVEKEAKVGGNSIKASSGINACRTAEDGKVKDEEIKAFVEDTVRSAGEGAHVDLIQTLVQNSSEALQWLKNRVDVDLLENHTQLGGHSRSRTHRPAKGAVGFSVISAMQKALKQHEEAGLAEIRVSTKVTELLYTDDKVSGVKVVVSEEETPVSIQAPNVVLATGGFAADRAPESLLAVHAPEYLEMPATFGEFSTGDGIRFATALGATTRHMNQVQVHPTGFVDPADPTSPSKILCAELMRGIGGILINHEGKRFCNELGTRSYITERMLEHDPQYAVAKRWDPAFTIPTFYLVMSGGAKEKGGEHIGFYEWKKLLRPYKGISELAGYMGVSKETLVETLDSYKTSASNGADEFGKTNFPGMFPDNLAEETFYAGQVTPVLHYCMGGLSIDTEANVLDADGKPIPGLYAAGEVAGGVHGHNRLAGNSLLECLVYGSIIGKRLPISKL